MDTHLRCSEEEAKAIIERIRNPDGDESLRKALNDAIYHLDMKEDEYLHDALADELKRHGIELDQLLEKHPNVVWRKENPTDPNWEHGFTLKK